MLDMDLVAVMAPKSAFGASPKGGAGASSMSAKVNSAVKGLEPLGTLSPEQVRDKGFQTALADPAQAVKLFPLIDAPTLKIIRTESDAVIRVPDSEQGVDRAFKDAGIKSRRQKIKILSAVYKFLDKLGSRDRKDYQKGGKIDPATVAASAVWMAASSAVPALRIAKSVAMKVLKSMVGALKIAYNNNCGGKAGQAIGDFSDVGGAGRQEGKCQAADGEPKWIDTGFAPYVWKTAISTSQWSYSPLGVSKSKSQILELLEKRKKRGKKAPPTWGKGADKGAGKGDKKDGKKGGKKGGKNFRPLPAALILG